MLPLLSLMGIALLLTLLPALPAQAAEVLVWTGERSMYYGGIVAASEAFEKKTGIRVTAIPGGCGTAAKGIDAKKIDVGGLCCLPKEEELTKKNFHAYPISFEALVIVVHNTNPIDNLTQKQVREVFSGKIANWKEVGGKDAAIKVITRLHCQDREGNWKQILPDPKQFKPAKNVKEDQEVLLEVGNTPTSIAFISLTMVNRKFAKVIKVDGVAPSRDSLIAGTYPWKSQNTLIVKGEPQGKAKLFIDFLQGEGRKHLHKELAFADELKQPAKTAKKK
ncbi:MAG: substrate-binding domain-containing protein [Nitrospirae bacterium]|nr:substrate-binding domain-containing protein [Nitrospirota bacterium]